MDVSRQSNTDEVERGPRARTRRLMLETASRLMQSGVTPSVTEAAEAAGVSRATAYRYFPSQAALVHVLRSDPQMSFRAINQKYLEPGSQILMVLGIVALCQPWNMLPQNNNVLQPSQPFETS